jgi:hypothetical protein
MVPLSMITVAAGGESLSHDSFFLGETICFGSLEFITDCFGGLSLSPRRDGLNVAAMGSTHSGQLSPLRHDKGQCRDVPHGFGRTRGDRPPLSQKAQYGRFACPRHNHVVAGEHSDHLGDDNDSIMAGHRPPFRVMAHSSRRETSTSPRSATQHRVGGNAMVE